MLGSLLMRAGRMFIQANKRISRWETTLMRRLIMHRCGMADFADRVLPDLIRPGMRVLDVGGGKRPSIDVGKKKELGLWVVGLDLSEQELNRAPSGAYDQIVVGDVARASIPGQFDLILSNTVLEHVADTRLAMSNLASAMKEGAIMAHLVPCRYALFAVINRMLGKRLAKKVLYCIFPERRELSGFDAFYDQCVPSKMRRICEDRDLEIVEITPYYHSNYFIFFAPAHALDICRRMLTQILGLRDFAETFVVVARKHTRASRQRTAA